MKKTSHSYSIPIGSKQRQFLSQFSFKFQIMRLLPEIQSSLFIFPFSIFFSIFNFFHINNAKKSHEFKQMKQEIWL